MEIRHFPHKHANAANFPEMKQNTRISTAINVEFTVILIPNNTKQVKCADRQKESVK